MCFCWFTSFLPLPPKRFFWGTTVEIKPHSFFVCVIPAVPLRIYKFFHFLFCITVQFLDCRFIWKSYVNFSFIEFIFVMVKDTCLIACLVACLVACLLGCLLTYLLTCLLTYLLTYLFTYLLTDWLTYLLTYVLTYLLTYQEILPIVSS